MREIKTLLKILLKKVEKDGADGSGLCWATEILFRRDIINDNEVGLMIDYIEENMPNSPKGYPYFGWTPGLPKGRIKWLEKQIKKLS